MKTLEVHPSVGMEVTGLNLSQNITADVTAELLEIAARHGFVLLRGQDLSPQVLLELANLLGDPLPPYRPQYSAPDVPEVVQIGNLPLDTGKTVYLNRGGVEWHTDSPGSSRPPGVSLLYCLESIVPDGGGETAFLSTIAGLEALSTKLQSRAEKTRLVHSFNTFNDKVVTYEGSDVQQQSGELRERNRDTLDDMVQHHPLTGDRHLYFAHAMIKQFDSENHEEGMRFVMEVLEEISRDKLVYRHKWSPGDLVIFDNRSSLHTPMPYAWDDYPRTRRLLHQVIIGGAA